MIKRFSRTIRLRDQKCLQNINKSGLQLHFDSSRKRSPECLRPFVRKIIQRRRESPLQHQHARRDIQYKLSHGQQRHHLKKVREVVDRRKVSEAHLGAERLQTCRRRCAQMWESEVQSEGNQNGRELSAAS